MSAEPSVQATQHHSNSISNNTKIRYTAEGWCALLGRISFIRDAHRLDIPATHPSLAYVLANSFAVAAYDR